MIPWFIRYFPPMKIREACQWVLSSEQHIALHENLPAFSDLKVRAYHVFGSDPDTLEKFGRLAGCNRSILGVIRKEHGRKVWQGRIIYHYDDWRRNMDTIYENLIKEYEK